MQGPCKKNGIPCADRRMGCHAECAAYLEYRACMDNRRHVRQKAALVENARFDLHRSAIRKAKHGD